MFAPTNAILKDVPTPEEGHRWHSLRTKFGVLALAASAGGIQAFETIVSGLPAEFPLPVLVVQHRGKRIGGEDILARVLSKSSKLPVMVAQNGLELESGVVYVSPPDLHMTVSLAGSIVLDDLPPVEYNRPSINLLFASLAEQFGPRALIVVLSGARDDGCAGLMLAKNSGSRTFAQLPLTAAFPSMPAAAIETGQVDFVLPLERIASALITLTMVPGADDLFYVPSAMKTFGTERV